MSLLTAIECDLCGKEEVLRHKTKTTDLTFTVNEGTRCLRQGTINLCEECSQSFEEWCLSRKSK